MFNNLKSLEIFDPEKCKEQIHVIGCGAVGGAISELLVRLGVKRIHIWDDDLVSDHNLGNQIYTHSDTMKPKTTCLSKHLREINPELEVPVHARCDKTERMSGIIFLCVDNIDTRRELCEKWQTNPNIKFIVDTRMRAVDGYVYAADWSIPKAKDDLIASMQFTHEEALKETPVSACGMTLSLIVTPRMIAALAVSNFIKFINTNTYNKFMILDGYKPFLDVYEA